MSDDGVRRQRAALAEELGFYPAEVDEESIDRHRSSRAGRQGDPARRWQHLVERKRQDRTEAVNRTALQEAEG